MGELWITGLALAARIPGAPGLSASCTLSPAANVRASSRSLPGAPSIAARSADSVQIGMNARGDILEDAIGVGGTKVLPEVDAAPADGKSAEDTRRGI
jgi:hypothetical protein